MSKTVCVFGLWHLGCVTAACLADAGAHVVGLDLDAPRVAALARGEPPIAEPGLADLIRAGLTDGTLTFSSRPVEALAEADVLWVTFDTPVDDDDEAHPEWVRQQLELVRPHLRQDALVLVSSQVPVGFTRALERDWQLERPDLRFACSPENLRLGQAIQVFQHPERIVVGLGMGTQRERVAALFGPDAQQFEWMSLESAEMTKHALNGFLALSVAYTNELARICERVGADARDVERGLRSEPRIGRRAYVSPGPPIAGGTLVRDIRFLSRLAQEHGLQSPIVDGVRRSNELHQAWSRDWVQELVRGLERPCVTLLGLTYKAGTDTLRRSAALDLASTLAGGNIHVRGFDPAIRRLPPEVRSIDLATSIDEALTGADVTVVATGWPEFRQVTADQIVRSMRHPVVVDQAGFLPELGADPRLTYIRVGQPRPARVTA